MLDTTLRDGEQAPGVAFTRVEKLHLAGELDKLGVDIIEAGIPAMGSEEIECLQAMNAMGLSAALLTWSRLKPQDIDCAAATGIKNAHIAVPSSPIHMSAKLGMTEDEVLCRAAACIEYALGQGLTVSAGAEDASRADRGFVIRLFRLAESLGAVRVRYADTMGILSPFTAYEEIKRIREQVGIDIDFHGHNDFGMATANAQGAWRGGANVISCSVNGLGERAGNTPLEEIVLALEHMDNCITNVDKTHIKAVSEIVERCSGKRLQGSKPIVGRDVFAHESGIHVDGLFKCRQTYEALAPGELGRHSEIVLGKFSGRKSMIQKFGEMGITIDKETAGDILNYLRSRSYVQKMNRDDFNDIIKNISDVYKSNAPSVM